MLINRFRVAFAVHALIPALVFPAFGNAQSPTKDVRISGMGVRKCAEWQQWKETRNGEARALVLEWTQGFIAGHNVYTRSGTEAANSVVADTKVLIPLIDSYCERNPESRIFSVVIQITQGLGGTKITVGPKAPAPQYPQRENKEGREF
jgi:hypothetical protein